VGAVWLGMTVGCATCHDHKFDPILQKDFYALGAFFRNGTQKIMDGNLADTPPIIFVPREKDRAVWEQKTGRLKAVAAQMEQTGAAAAGDFEKWLAERTPELKAEPIESAADAFAAAKPAAGETLKDSPKAEAEHAFSVSVRFLAPEKSQRYVVVSQQNSKDRGRGWAVDADNGQIAFRLIGDNGQGIEVRAAEARWLVPGTWNELVGAYDGSRNQTGMMLYLNGEPVVLVGLGARTGRLNGSIETEEDIVLGKPMKAPEISEFHLYHRVLSQAEAHLLAVWPDTSAALKHPTAQLTANARGDLLDWFLARNYAPYKKLEAEQHRLNLDVRELQGRGSASLVMQERTDQMPFAYTLYRGAYDQKRERVEAHPPSILPPMAAALPRNRLGFAKWLFSEDQPLTGRVAVNRMWQEIFGVGITKTADDFGSQGEPPSHAQLLDWLAVDFRESGWDMKRFYRQVLNSATYRQMALATPEKIAKDPENRHGRRNGPRLRAGGDRVARAASRWPERAALSARRNLGERRHGRLGHAIL
jgi:hypothetical protein